jgi:hypothetical protein
VRPFHVIHPVRGNFGDPRTIFLDDLGKGGLRGPGWFSFHDGVDISAPLGAAVYPVVSGRARVSSPGLVSIRTKDGRRFRYIHISVSVRNRSFARAGRTVLGYIKWPWRHVHLTEVDPIRIGFQVVNPLTHLVPYAERIPPRIRWIGARDRRGLAEALSNLHGRVELLVDAYGFPARPLSGAWQAMPVAPALIRWQMTTARGKIVIRERAAVDFRRTIPPKRRFWQVYARGTYQNFPVIGAHYYWRRKGLFLYLLDRRLNTRLLQNGRYLITVTVADICDKSRSLALGLRVLNRPAT